MNCLCVTFRSSHIPNILLNASSWPSYIGKVNSSEDCVQQVQGSGSQQSNLQKSYMNVPIVKGSVRGKKRKG